ASERISALLISLELNPKFISLVTPGIGDDPSQASAQGIESASDSNRMTRFNLVALDNIASNTIGVIERKIRIRLCPIT
ncbi:hypothetical protein SB751_35560, partial [Cupriavidus sp. SIMBA_020]|uniref:hypothetical protein n=1 Tax=Cupriavidus sp. SIMBA_020 TaxID=3085766 RepID=UPI003978039C